ncbi:hypothetical protein HAX54_041713, partial [Datura stramonium]|nr:hypothetical protein [Datura stramonium]
AKMESSYETHVTKSLILRLDIELPIQNITIGCRCCCRASFELQKFEQFVVSFKSKSLLCSWPILSHSLLCFEVKPLLHLGQIVVALLAELLLHFKWQISVAFGQFLLYFNEIVKSF